MANPSGVPPGTPAGGPPAPTAEPLLRILHEDDGLLVLNKPAGLVPVGVPGHVGLTRAGCATAGCSDYRALLVAKRLESRLQAAVGRSTLTRELQRVAVA